MLRLPTIQGVIDRRMLVNYHMDPAVIAPLLPSPFRPKLANGYAIAGICLIRLRHIRPTWWPLPVGLASENAAHRIAVEWDDDGQVRQGVYIPRRDTSSRLNALAGGRLFPGEHHHARFRVRESAQRLTVALQSDDGKTRVNVDAHVGTFLPEASVFSSVSEASAFFEAGSLGYSATSDPRRLDGIELDCKTWKVEPLALWQVESSFFDDRRLFPKGSIEFDCGLLMRGIEHQWRSRESLCCEEAVLA